MNGLKRQVSPGAAVFLVIVILAVVQWSWWRGLIYRAPVTGPALAAGPPPTQVASLSLQGRDYVKVVTLAGAVPCGYVDGPGYQARFDRPTGLAVDTAGKLYVCDTGNHRIRVVASDGSVQTLAGGEQGDVDGPEAQAKFNAPCGICSSPEGNLYIADTGNGSVRCIQGGQVTTIVRHPNTLVGSQPFLPIAVSYERSSPPMLLVLDAGLKSIQQYDLKGVPHGAPTPLVSLVIAGQAGSTGYKADLPNVMQIDGTEVLDDVSKRPVVAHLNGWCQVGLGSLLTDNAHGAVLYKKFAKAEVLAGNVDSGGPVRDWKDGNGATSQFGNPTCIVSDGVRYAYVADTGNNCIRRLTLPDFLFH